MQIKPNYNNIHYLKLFNFEKEKLVMRELEKM